MTVAAATASKLTRRRRSADMPSVTAMNTGTIPNGSMATNSGMKVARKVRRKSMGLNDETRSQNDE